MTKFHFLPFMERKIEVIIDFFFTWFYNIINEEAIYNEKNNRLRD